VWQHPVSPRQPKQTRKIPQFSLSAVMFSFPVTIISARERRGEDMHASFTSVMHHIIYNVKCLTAVLSCACTSCCCGARLVLLT